MGQANLSSRRRFFTQSGGALGAMAFASLLSKRPSRAADNAAAKLEPHVKRVVWLFMHGGPSHVDLFDPKSDLISLSGKPVPDSFGMFGTRRDVAKNPLLGPVKPFQPRGECGMQISDFLPETARFADDLCLIRSVNGDSVNHPQSVYQMNTGNLLMGKPSVGSWVTYGLGSENQDLPTYIVMPDPGGGLKGGPPAWGSGFLPAQFQGVTMRAGAKPILNLAPQEEIGAARQQRIVSLINDLNRNHAESRDQDDELAARIRSYELAFRMQSAAPDLVDLTQETPETLSLYGVDEESTRDFGQRCLLARRMLERGVRFVQLYSGDTNGWDAHGDVLSNHRQYCRATDKPVAGLLADLKRRGLWQDTLVIWGGEFGRMPMSEQGKGRDHNPWGYSMWLAGGAVKGGFTYGETDAIGLRAVKDKVHIRDFHATLLHLLGLNPKEFAFSHNGLDERLIGPTDEARVVKELFA